MVLSKNFAIYPMAFHNSCGSSVGTRPLVLITVITILEFVDLFFDKISGNARANRNDVNVIFN